jgi:hypothetical protein
MAAVTEPTTRRDAKAGFCSPCRRGGCSLCASSTCLCPDGRRHHNRPDYGRPPHGTARRFHSGCRCDACYEAERVYQEEWRRKNGVGPKQAGRTHGIRATYTAGCRCDECRAADTAYKARTRGSVPTGRRRPRSFTWCIGCGERPAQSGGIACLQCIDSQPRDFRVVHVDGETFIHPIRTAAS